MIKTLNLYTLNPLLLPLPIGPSLPPPTPLAIEWYYLVTICIPKRLRFQDAKTNKLMVLFFFFCFNIAVDNQNLQCIIPSQFSTLSIVIGLSLPPPQNVVVLLQSTCLSDRDFSIPKEQVDGGA